jgi:hypothetical protein
MQIRPVGSADEITEYLDRADAVALLVARLSKSSRLALSLFALTETTSMSLAELKGALVLLGAEPTAAIGRLLELGLMAIEPGADFGPVEDFHVAIARAKSAEAELRIHPSVPRAVRTVRPEGKLPRVAGPVNQVREADGLEPILRLGALWQRVGAEPLRQTRQETLYKRDQERIERDPVLISPITDSLGPLPHSGKFWLAVARHVGLVKPDPMGGRLLAAPPEFWTDNGVHLPQMIATAWMAEQSWQERTGPAPVPTAAEPALRYLRSAVLLWLATLGESEWAALDEVAEHLKRRWPAPAPVSFSNDLAAGALRPLRGRARVRAGEESAPGALTLLGPLLLGAAYPLGLVRAAEERASGRRVVQLTPLGRYVLALGPAPPPRAAFEHFLLVQPNFEMIAYRQGLTPQLVGRLSQFAWWSQIGAALELKLTRESIGQGLDLGLTPESILEVLTRHSARPMPPGVIDAVRTWAGHHQRVIYYAAATLIEFGSQLDRDDALRFWPASESAAPIAVAERLLLVEDERSVPFDRLRLAGSRDYRRPPELCVTIEPDGVTLAVDPARSDLLVDAELARFAEPLPAQEPLAGQSAGAASRRFIVTPASLRRAISRGMSPVQFADWYRHRSGGEVPPAVRLLLLPKTSRVPPIEATRTVVLKVSSVELLDGLLQHPATSPWLGERLGPTSVTLPDDRLEPLQEALKELGINLAAGRSDSGLGPNRA